MSQHQDQGHFAASDAWPSPPLEPGDVGLNYSFGPAGSTSADVTYEIKCSPACAATGSFVPEEPLTQHQGQISPQALQLTDVCTPTSLIDHSGESPDMVYSQLNGSVPFDAGCGRVPHNVHAIRPDLTLRSNGPDLSPRPQSSPYGGGSPRSAHIPRAFATPPLSHPAHLQASREAQSPECDKADEPYAKLIYRAFMSRPDYSMTLQQIYQWFRENSSKALTETGGWQNSIRHNLSMNAVSFGLIGPLPSAG